MGTIDLKRQVVTRVIDKMLEFSVEHIAEIKKQFQFAKIEAERLAEERRMALQSLEKCVKAKEQLEVDLYSKFSLILNEKKLKISELLASDKGRWKEDILNQERPGPSKRLNVYDSTAHDDNDRRETLAMETTPSVATKNDGSLLNVDYSPTSESPMVPLPRKPRTLRNKTVNRPPKNNIETKSLKSKSAELLAACEMDTLELAEEL